jgi:hypothetical protein
VASPFSEATQRHGETMTEELAAIEPSAVGKLKAWIADNLEVLKATNIVTIIGEYSGSGDEGQWDGLSAEPIDAIVNLDRDKFGELETLMDAACDELAEPGYQDGDGGGGDLKLIVSSGKLLHSSYFYETTRSYTSEDDDV